MGWAAHPVRAAVRSGSDLTRAVSPTVWSLERIPSWCRGRRKQIPCGNDNKKVQSPLHPQAIPSELTPLQPRSQVRDLGHPSVGGCGGFGQRMRADSELVSRKAKRIPCGNDNKEVQSPLHPQAIPSELTPLQPRSQVRDLGHPSGSGFDLGQPPRIGQRLNR